MSSPVQYANWWSKLLFKKKFERQFFIPIPPSSAEKSAVAWLEKRLLKNQDLENTISIDKPIFILGLPRSGTTLIYNLLCAHPQSAYVTNVVNAFPESPYAIEWLRKKMKWDIKGERFLNDSIDVGFGSPSEPLTFWGRWMGRDVSSLYWAEQTRAELGEVRVQLIKNDLRKMIASFGGQSRRFITKYPVMQTELKVLQEIFPDAKFIHILRDPRPAANSLVKLHQLTQQQLDKIDHPEIKSLVPYPRVKGLSQYVETYGASSLQCTSRVWVDAIELVLATAPSLKNYYQFKYEDLLADPETELRTIFKFCELEWPGEDSKFREQFVKIGKIRHKNSYSGYPEILEIAGSLMKHLGYEI